MTRSIRTFGWSLLFVLSVAACGKKQPAPGEAEVAPAQVASANKEGDPCSLLEPKEAEAVMGALAGPPYRAREGSAGPEPAENGDLCVYETADFRTIQLSVEWTDGAMAYKGITLPSRMLSGVTGDENTASEVSAAKTVLPGGVQIAGEWDEASSMGCCTVYALRGDQMVTFDYRGWKADTPAAVGLLNKALVRLDQPLSIDGNAGNAAALAHDKQRPASRPACELVLRAEVESIVGPLAADPKPASADGLSCTLRFTQAESAQSPFKGLPPELTSMLGKVGPQMGMTTGQVDTGINVMWRGGFRQLNDSAQVSGAVMGAVGGGPPGMPTRKQGPVAGGPWDEALQTSITFIAVKKDVAVTIDTLPVLSEEQVELRRRLVAKVIERI
jgi:hypothetical protein